MQTSKKHLLGAFGLAAVLATTAYAATIPTPDADAVSASGDVKVSVTVHDEVPEIEITSIVDGETFTDGVIPIGTRYEHADRIDYKLYKVTDEGNVEIDLSANAVYTPTVAGESGTRSFDIDLDALANAGHGDYILTTVLSNNGSTVEDSVSFSYVAQTITPSEPDENGNPVLDVNYGPDATEVIVQIYDKDGNPMFNPPLVFPIENPGTPGSITITLPLDEYGIPTGDYVAVISTYDADGNLIGEPSYYAFHYDAKEGSSTPITDDTDIIANIPKTGQFTTPLNLSRTDYLVTGLIIFGAATAFAAYVLRRQRKSNRK